MSVASPTGDAVLAAYTSGELLRLVAQHGSLSEVGAALGLTKSALRNAMIRLRERGHALPHWAELAKAAVVSRSTQATTGEPSAVRIEAVMPPTRVEVRTVNDDIADRQRRAETRTLQARLDDALSELERTRARLAIATDAEVARYAVQPIERRETSSGMREATAVALASDWHIEQTVDPAKVNGVNEYNLAIAKRRVERYFSGLSYLIRYHEDHFAIRDAVLWLGGDLITGHIHDENLETNELAPAHAIATLHVWIADGIRAVLAQSDITSLRVVCNSGNHGRLTKKMRAATREDNSIEWLLYAGLAREFAGEPRVSFTLPHGAQTYVQIYDWVYRFLHGDLVKYQGGVGGITVPLFRALARWQTVRHAHVTCCGHWHQYYDLPGLVVNGSLIGYDEFALSIGAPYEDPRQAFFLVDSRRGKTFPADIWVADRGEP